VIVNLNGREIESGAHVPTGDRGFLLGDGAFETIYVARGAPAFLDRHLERLQRGLSILRIPRPDALDHAAEIIASLSRLNGLEGHAAARITVSRGEGPRGLAIPEIAPQPTLLVTVSSWAPPQGCARVVLTGHRRITEAAGNIFKPIGGYIENILAYDAARRVGADDAILLNEFGRVVSASAANIFVIDGAGRISTPPVAEGAMPGIVRSLILQRAGEAVDVTLVERPIDIEELNGRSLLLTNSLVGLRAASLPGSAPIGGELEARLSAWFNAERALSLGKGACAL